MVILGIHNGHDGAAALYIDGQLVAYCKEERLTRIKSDGRRIELAAIDEVLKIAGLERNAIDVFTMSRMNLPVKYFTKTASSMNAAIRKLRGKTIGIAGEMGKLQEPDEAKLLDLDKIRKDLSLRTDCRIEFVNHHYSHVLGAFQFTTWENNALYLSCDGGGDGAFYSAYSWDGEALKCLYGGEETVIESPHNNAASIGQAYSAITKHLGFKGNRHEGKITGLAAFGKPILADAFVDTFKVNADGSIDSVFDSMGEWVKWMKEKAVNVSKEDLAASIQIATEIVVLKWIDVLRKIFNAEYIGLSGGVFSNVRLNQKVAELPGVKEIFVFPAMGDEGLPVGNCVNTLIEDNGIKQLKRRCLSDVYLGYQYTADDLLNLADEKALHVLRLDDPAEYAAKLMHKGLVGAIYSERMEMGPRALGARSIIAAPVQRELNDTLNGRLERTEFMPFAPYVLEEDAEEVFVVNDINRHACEFMTVTTDVNEKYVDVIPAVVHVDKTARPQIIKRKTNPLYYDALKAYKAISDVPCLVNTSFNAHEEPIINTPEEAIKPLVDKRIDFLLCDKGIVAASSSILETELQ